MLEAWQLIREAGPLALAGAFFLVWWLERDRVRKEGERADRERQLNEARTDKLYELGTTMRDALAGINRNLDRMLDRRDHSDP
jgi:hypothetical protein